MKQKAIIKMVNLCIKYIVLWQQWNVTKEWKDLGTCLAHRSDVSVKYSDYLIKIIFYHMISFKRYMTHWEGVLCMCLKWCRFLSVWITMRQQYPLSKNIYNTGLQVFQRVYFMCLYSSDLYWYCNLPWKD